jgi:hypothetical protein
MPSIFLSHSHKDKPFAGRLSERLQAHGIRTWLDEAEMHVGDSLILKIETAIREFTYLGVILSRASVSSEWVRKEVHIAMTEEIQGRRVKVLPILYEECDVPGFLTDKLYADFTEDFNEGFEKLLARLTSDLREEENRQKRARGIFQAAYQDWISFERQDHLLLDRNKLDLVLQHLVQPKMSLDLLEYVFCSVSHLPVDEEIDLGRLKNWLSELDVSDVAELFDRLLEHHNPRVRLGAAALVKRLGEKDAVDTLMTRMKDEGDIDVRRAGLRSIFHLGRSLPNDIAQSFLNTDQDWVTQSYAFRNLVGYRPCLLISDESEFAADLGAMAHNAGFNLVAPKLLIWEFEGIEDEDLTAYELLILVRGEHFIRHKNEPFYSQLLRFVSKGGSLFATSWVSWETIYDNEFADALPFAHIQNKYYEDRLVSCRTTASDLSLELFPSRFPCRTSYELLEHREGSVVLLETDTGTPIFGYRRFGSGICYYLNTCQHSCLGHMRSPLETSSEFRGGVQRVFEWIFETPTNPE